MPATMTALAIPAAIFTIFALAAFAQAVSGFGFALVAVPLLALSTEPRTAVVAAGIVGLALTVITTVAERDHVRWRPARVLLAAAAAGMPIGLVLLVTLPEAGLTALIAIVTLGCTILVWRGWQMSASPASIGMAGLVSGVLTTSTGTNGPPLAAALQSMGLAPRHFRATLAAIFTASLLLSLAGFAATGALTGQSATIALAGLPAVVLGYVAGNRHFVRIDALRFRTVLLVALVTSSTITLTAAVSNMV